MTRIDFHTNIPDKLAYACRLARKAYGARAKVVVLAESQEQAEALNAALWNVGDTDFIPHVMAADPLAPGHGEVCLLHVHPALSAWRRERQLIAIAVRIRHNAEDLEARAHALFEDGEAANTYSDVYTLTTLLFAAALFFAAIAERFDSARARIALLILAGTGLIAGVSVALGQPITGG